MTHTEVRTMLMECLAAEECCPFGPDVLVYKCGGKIFALLTEPTQGFRLSLKCNPERAQLLRGQFAAITPGYHLNKEHWNTLDLEQPLPDDLVRELVTHSHELIFSSLSKRQQRECSEGAV